MAALVTPSSLLVKARERQQAHQDKLHSSANCKHDKAGSSKYTRWEDMTGLLNAATPPAVSSLRGTARKRKLCSFMQEAAEG